MKPHAHLCSVIENILSKLTIECGAVVATATPSLSATEVACHRSKPLRTLIAHMLKESDNLYANTLFKFLGAYQTGLGTWESGKKALKMFLKNEVGIMPGSYVMEDGAGLSRYNLISPSQIVQLLSWVYNHKELFDVFCECLAHSGQDGTLKRRMLNYPGVIKAKTVL